MTAPPAGPSAADVGSTDLGSAQAPATRGRPVDVLSAAPRAVAVAAAGTGIAAAVVLPAGPPGLGLVLLGLSGAGLLLLLSPAPLRGWRAVHGCSALLLLGSAAVRDAAWVVLLDLAAALVLGSLAAAGGRSWAGVARGVAELGLAAPTAVRWLGRGARAVPVPAGGPLLRGGALTAALLAVFGPLLASADPAFAAALERLAPVSLDPATVLGRILLGVVAATGMGAAALVLVAPRPEPTFPAPSRRLDQPAEWLLPLGALAGLLAAFVLVQATVLFAGRAHVLTGPGITYASYAREGFGQLVAVTALVLAVVAAAVRWAPRSARPLLGLLCGLALVIDASAVSRLGLYSETYGLTRLRMSATVLALGLGAVLVLVLLAGLRPGGWLPNAVVLATSVGLLGLTAADPDARIAESALARGVDADLGYLSTLSADAVPVLDRLPEPARSCVLPGPTPPGGWLSANLARNQAERVLQARPPGPCSAAGVPR